LEDEYFKECGVADSVGRKWDDEMTREDGQDQNSVDGEVGENHTNTFGTGA
jgi:hypothetical protein